MNQLLPEQQPQTPEHFSDSIEVTASHNPEKFVRLQRAHIDALFEDQTPVTTPEVAVSAVELDPHQVVVSATQIADWFDRLQQREMHTDAQRLRAGDYDLAA